MFICVVIVILDVCCLLCAVNPWFDRPHSCLIIGGADDKLLLRQTYIVVIDLPLYSKGVTGSWCHYCFWKKSTGL